MPGNEHIIDVNVTFGQWPTRRVPCDDIEKLKSKLRDHSVTEAWAGHFDGLFHNDLTEVNNRLAIACTFREPLAPPVPSSDKTKKLTTPAAPNAWLKLVPFGEINPLDPNWESELDRCVTVHRMPGVRVHPNYHNYKLDHPNFARLLKAAGERKVVVQLTTIMEDARMMHSLMRVPPVDLAPLEKLVAQTPGLKLILLNALTTASRTDQLYRITLAGDVFVEIAMLETIAALETVLKDIPLDRILFGSHVPSFYFESAILKLQESKLPNGHRRAICYGTARRLLPTKSF
jgi:uncharacterized protein